MPCTAHYRLEQRLSDAPAPRIRPDVEVFDADEERAGRNVGPESKQGGPRSRFSVPAANTSRPPLSMNLWSCSAEEGGTGLLSLRCSRRR